ncbi:MAG: heavy-metal-associated domain-containing protein [Oxalobacteraceae bacterium]
MKITVIKVVGMNTAECVRQVTNAIQDLPGIGQVALSLASGVASIEHGPMVSEQDIHQAVLDAGFDVG